MVPREKKETRQQRGVKKERKDQLETQALLE